MNKKSQTAWVASATEPVDETEPPKPFRFGAGKDLWPDFDWDEWDALDAEVAKLWNWETKD